MTIALTCSGRQRGEARLCGGSGEAASPLQALPVSQCCVVLTRAPSWVGSCGCQEEQGRACCGAAQLHRQRLVRGRPQLYKQDGMFVLKKQQMPLTWPQHRESFLPELQQIRNAKRSPCPDMPLEMPQPHPTPPHQIPWFTPGLLQEGCEDSSSTSCCHTLHKLELVGNRKEKRMRPG